MAKSSVKAERILRRRVLNAMEREHLKACLNGRPWDERLAFRIGWAWSKFKARRAGRD